MAALGPLKPSVLVRVQAPQLSEPSGTFANMCSMTYQPFSEPALRSAIAQVKCWADAMRLLGYEPKGHNYRTLKRHVKQWKISTAHFDPHVGRRRAALAQQIPLHQVLVENSTYARGQLKERLLATGLCLTRTAARSLARPTTS